jgi:sodium pump decarboxylase gamma subunit
MMSELFEAGLGITAIGMGVVFVLLTLLIGIIKGMSAISRRIEDSSREQTPNAASGSSVEDEIISVIGAAITAYRNRRR